MLECLPQIIEEIKFYFSLSRMKKNVLSILLSCYFTVSLGFSLSPTLGLASGQHLSPEMMWQQENVHPEVDEEPLSLFDCYRLAIKQSETIAIQQERIKEAEARFIQSLSGILPKASFSYSEKRQDGTGRTSFTLREVPENKFVFSQPLFSGFKEFANLARNRADRRKQVQEEIRAKQLLFTDVSDAFYLLLLYEEDLLTLGTIQSALIERIDELKKREELGRSRPSEVVSTEARLRRLEAELEKIRSEREVARQLLEFLTGQGMIKVTDPLLPLDPLLTPEYCLTKASTRPDVLAAKEAYRMAQNQVTIARGEFLPQVGLDGNYYTKRVGNSSGVDWDVTLKMDVPIFNGGENIGKLKEALSIAKELKLQFSFTFRRAMLEIKNSFTQWQSSLARSESLKKALLATEKNYKMQKEDYRFNLVNNLDVLSALEELQEVKREYLSTRNEVKRRYWNLKVTVGDISNDTL